MEIFTYLALAIAPAAVGVGLFLAKRLTWATISTCSVWVAFVGLAWAGWHAIGTQAFPIYGCGFRIDSLGLMLSLFVLFISGIVHLFSLRYLSGDQRFNCFFGQLGLLTSSLLFMIGADHLLFMLFFWTSSNLLLARLMIHKGDWSASSHSGLLMLKFSLLGSGLIALAVLMLFHACGSFSLHEILKTQNLMTHSAKSFILLLLILAALIQSGAWPFHKWLLSSLNSPTPVSGFMHAGLVNGGGVLLTRFAPLFSESDTALNALFSIGLVSVVLGTGWKLMQNNIKKMLACSTIAQMGFMLMQCGLGLFSAAIAHLLWHGLFKCYLFLNSGSAIQEKRDLDASKNGMKYLTSLLAGLPGAYGFALIVGFSVSHWTTEAVLIVFAWLAATQIAYSTRNKSSIWTQMIVSSVASFAFGITYGCTIYLIKLIVLPLGIDAVLPLNTIHVAGMAIVLLIYIGVNLNLFSLPFSRTIYVRMLNLSQSDQKTITSIRSEYKY